MSYKINHYCQSAAMQVSICFYLALSCTRAVISLGVSLRFPCIKVGARGVGGQEVWGAHTKVLSGEFNYSSTEDNSLIIS